MSTLTRSYFSIMGLHPLALGICDRVIKVGVRQFPLFRDCYPVMYEEGKLQLEAVTQPGMAEEDAVQPAIDMLRRHDLYVSDEVPPFDDTYRVFLFDLPHEDLVPDLKQMLELLEKHPEAIYKEPLNTRFAQTIIEVEEDLRKAKEEAEAELAEAQAEAAKEDAQPESLIIVP